MITVPVFHASEVDFPGQSGGQLLAILKPEDQPTDTLLTCNEANCMGLVSQGQWS